MHYPLHFRPLFFPDRFGDGIIQRMATSVRTYDQPGDQAAWDGLVTRAPGGHFLQSWAWGELKAQFGWRVQRLTVGKASAQVIFRSLPGGLGAIAYVPKGPRVDLEDEASLQALLDGIGRLAQRHRAICLKIEPDLEDAPRCADCLTSHSFVPSPHVIQPRRTLLVDLDATPEAVLKRMKQKTRYNIRLATRKGVTVRQGDESDLPDFYRLMELTAERDGFAIHSEAYYESAHRLFVTAGHGRLPVSYTHLRAHET